LLHLDLARVAHTIRPVVARRTSPDIGGAMSKFLCAAMVVVLGLAANTLGGTADLKLEGQYTVTGGERNGQALPPESINGWTFRFTNDKLVGATKDGSAFITADYTCDAAKTPSPIVLKITEGTNKGKEMNGLVEKKGDTVRIIYAEPGGEKPTEFKTKPNQTMFVLKAR
jgi:uncharacterized protein (TIGR03067 family)